MTDIQGYAILFLIWIITTIIVRFIFSKTKTRGRLPPSPIALPVIGHLHLLGPIPHQAFHKLSNRYGPLIHVLLGSAPCVVASSPEIAKEIFKTHELSFSSRPQTTATDYLSYGSAGFVFAPYGPYWKFMKKLCMSELLGGRTLDQFLPVRREEIQTFLRLMVQKSEAGEAVDVGGELMKLTSNVMSRMIMSRRCSGTEDEAGDVRKIVQEVLELSGKFNLSDFIGFCKKLDLQGFGKRLKDVHERFDWMMERIMKEHEEERRKKKEMGNGGDGVKDLLDILLDVTDEKNPEIILTRENIKAFVLDLFSGGSDTSSITTEWALAELINHPDVFEKAREEIDSVIGKSRLVEESDIPNLPYLRAIVKETLRLHPTGPLIFRQSTEDCQIKGYDIPAKTRTFINVWAIGRDPKNWDNPLEFRPERFIVEEDSSRSQLDVRGQHFHFLPFGSGRRGCPGISLALQVVQTSLACMIQCFEWKVGDEKNVSVDMTEGIGLSLPRAQPLVCIPIARLNPFAST